MNVKSHHSPKSKWETDQCIENLGKLLFFTIFNGIYFEEYYFCLARLDGTNKFAMKRKPNLEDYLQMDDWEERKSSDGKKRVQFSNKMNSKEVKLE